jgi:hypothetical protein
MSKFVSSPLFNSLRSLLPVLLVMVAAIPRIYGSNWG